MEALELARWQSGVTTVYHFLFVPVTIGLALSVAMMQTAWHRTKNPVYLRMTRFWRKPMLISFGQRQRILLARALLAEARFLILDEPSAHLDDDAAGALLPDLVDGVAAATGVLLITHRLDGLDLFDRVVVLERGRVVEAGPARELRARDGRFAALERWQEVSLSG